MSKITPLNETLIDKLSAKMENELHTYQNYLSTLSAAEIMDHAYELTVKKDIVYALDSIWLNLSPQQCKALLKTRSPLDKIYKAFSNSGTSWIDEISTCIQDQANKEIQKEQDVPIL